MNTTEYYIATTIGVIVAGLAVWMLGATIYWTIQQFINREEDEL